MNLEDYKKKIADYLANVMMHSTKLINEELKLYEKIIFYCYQRDWNISSVATMIDNEL